MSFTNCNEKLPEDKKITFKEIKDIFDLFFKELEIIKEMNRKLFFDVESLKNNESVKCSPVSANYFAQVSEEINKGVNNDL